MKEEKTVLEIVDLCARIDSSALEIYEILAGSAREEDLKALWQDLARDERGHELYWVTLKEVCAAGGVPEVFEDPDAVKGALANILPRIGVLKQKVEANPDPPTCFILALRLEFYLLHPAFAKLFYYLRGMPGKDSPGEDYENHLGRLLGALMDHHELSPELELLGETLGRVWRLNREGTALAMMDPLTETLNRRGLFIALKPLLYLARRDSHTLGLLMIDLDDFKEINDTHGHRIGDRVLAEAAGAVASRLRASDVLGRYGGEEFLALLTPVDPAHLKETAEKVRRGVEALSVEGVRPKVSVGAASGVIGDKVEVSLEELIRRADFALLEAKRLGKNLVVVDG